MATAIWVSQDGNWNAGGSWSSGAVPGLDDDVIFDGTSQISVTSGLDQSAAAKYSTLTVSTDYAGDIGTFADPLQCDCGTILFEGVGAFHHIDGGSQVDLMILASPSTAKQSSLDTNTTNRYKDLRIGGGHVLLKQGLSSEYQIRVAEYQGREVLLTIDPGLLQGVLPGALLVDGGVVRCHTSLTSLAMMGGELTLEVSGSSRSISYLTQMGGYVDYQDDGTMTLANVLGGYLEYGNDLRPKTITELAVFPGAVANLGDHVTVTTGGKIYEEVLSGG